jgi:predicted 3-demethylubiquinone-9 3-methyltransferase (glyoxalase superfamily)
VQQPITPFLWFDTQAEDAANFYTSIFPNSRISAVSRYPAGGPRPEGLVMTVAFELGGQRFLALNGGPQFSFDEAVSFAVSCASQDEIDYYWERLTDGGQEGDCGWLKDRFGLSWQVVPAQMGELMTNSDPEASRRAMEAMLQMHKLDIAALRQAAEGVAQAG